MIYLSFLSQSFKFLRENQVPLADLAIPDISPDNCVNPQIMVLAFPVWKFVQSRSGTRPDVGGASRG